MVVPRYQTALRKAFPTHHGKLIHPGHHFIHSRPNYLKRKKQFAIFAKSKYRSMKHLIIATSVDLVRIAPEGIVYISSDGNYSTLVQADGETRTLSFQLGQIETLISHQLDTEGRCFIRIGKSLIINRSYIYYINVAKQKLILSDLRSVSYTVSASKEALKLLKELLEKEGE